MGVHAQNYTSAIILNSKIANICYYSTFITNCDCFLYCFVFADFTDEANEFNTVRSINLRHADK